MEMKLRLFFLRNLSNDVELQLSKEDVQLPVAFSHFREPWVRHHNSKIFESEVFDRNWRKVFQRKVQGLNDTVQGVFDWLSKSNCLFFAWGGSVRDAVTATQSDFSELSVEPLDFAHWNTSFEVHPSKFEYSPNTLSVMFEGRSSSLRALLIDISGFSLRDVCGRIIRIPAKEEFWNEWATEKSIIKVYRYWKLRAAGYFPWTDDEKNFLVDFSQKEFTESSFFTFVCHYVLSGKVLQPVEGDLNCDRPVLPNGKLSRLISVLKSDFGVKYYQRTFKPIIAKVVYGKTEQ
ncbi:hypothetical protein WR25_17871 [Diploscapter pachys]|uniref:Poly A polymerase head domain-containing protein n=1 Tax=Diploscapter pachys TaxID=2018661 RepID=A0A2A2K7T2_9BILA|nr:hypothetical protein WR25_17871 [Diploscapter pachys]